MAEKLSITVPADMVDAARRQVSSGSYANISDVFQDAMRVWMRQQDEQEARLSELRMRVQQSLDDPRPRIPMDDVFDQLIGKYEKMDNRK